MKRLVINFLIIVFLLIGVPAFAQDWSSLMRNYVQWYSNQYSSVNPTSSRTSPCLEPKVGTSFPFLAIVNGQGAIGSAILSQVNVISKTEIRVKYSNPPVKPVDKVYTYKCQNNRWTYSP